jgi:hypothetical protein
MTVSTISPGSYCTVSADSPPLRYASIQSPTPGMPVVAQDIIDLSQVVMNVQASAIDGVRGGTYQVSAPIQFLNSQMVFASNSTLWIGQGGFLQLGDQATVYSNAAAAWGGTYTYASAVLAGDFAFGDVAGANPAVITVGVDSSIAFASGAGIAIRTGAYLYNAGSIDNLAGGKGHLYPFIDRLIDPTGTTPSHGTPYPTARDVPEVMSIEMGSGSAVFDVPAGVARQRCRVTVAQSNAAYTAEIHFLHAGGGDSVVVTLRYYAGSFYWADLRCDGTDWWIEAEGTL